MSVDDQLAALENMALADMRALWVKLTGGPTLKVSVAMLRMAVAWEIQARASGGLARATQQRLQQIASAKTTTTVARRGMRLVREWGGVAHIVTVDEQQRIHWNGKEWTSLSELARAITGTRWSGPAFFGLKKRIAA